MQRTLRHGACLAATLATAGLAGPPGTAQGRLSLATAWLCLGFLVAALAIGPWQTLRTGRPVLNHLARRDLGIWAGLTGLLHLGFATAVVMTPAYFASYIRPGGEGLPGLAGWIGTGSILAGYVIGLAFLVLLAVSNNASLRRLGPERWKRIQRWAVGIFVATAVHGVIFQFIEGRTGPWLLALAVATAGVLGLRRQARTVCRRVHAGR